MTKLFLLGAGKEIDTEVQVVAENQILIGYGYAMSESRYVVYKVEIMDKDWGYQYHVIDVQTKDINRIDIIRPLSEKFGVGIYYDDTTPEFMDSMEVAILLQDAQQKAKTQLEEQNRNITVQIKEKTDNTPPSDGNTTAKNNCTLVEYSDKALAVFGDTKSIKDELRAMGGRFNSRLTFKGEKIAGWVFSKSKEQRLAYYFGLN